MSETFRIFVYGLTLSGEAEHARLEGARLVGRAHTTAAYALADLGVYPALVEDGDTQVAGEVYEVSAQVRFKLDVFHERGVLFERKLVQLEGEASAESYVMAREKAGGKRRIWNGSWKDRFAPRPRGTSAAMNPFAERARRLRS